jgi:outer membrane receptor protein involved in Fe transport
MERTQRKRKPFQQLLRPSIHRFSGVSEVRRSAWYSSAYLQDSWQIIPGWLQLNFGGRTEHFTSTGQNLWMPRASLSLRVTHNDKFTFSWGQYGQFPSFRQLFGEVYNNDLRAERATHYIVGIEHRLNDKTRIRVEGYEIRLREASTRPIRNGVLHAHWT